MRYTAAVVVLVGVVLVGVVAGIALGTWGGASDAPGVGEEEHRQLGHGAPHRLATARDRELAGDAQSAQNVLPREHRRAVTLASRKLEDRGSRSAHPRLWASALDARVPSGPEHYP